MKKLLVVIQFVPMAIFVMAPISLRWGPAGLRGLDRLGTNISQWNPTGGGEPGWSTISRGSGPPGGP
jgi:hypothetical protein